MPRPLGRARQSAGLVAGFLLCMVTVPARGEVPLPEVPRGKGERCVEPVELMRRDHMEFLLHQRDLTVHDGVRSKRHSLVECIACHAGRDESGAYVPINAPDQFCEGCHSYAAVDIDCFECHATVPPAPAGAGGAGPDRLARTETRP